MSDRVNSDDDLFAAIKRERGLAHLANMSAS